MSQDRDSASIVDIVGACQTLATVIVGVDEEAFAGDIEKQWAVLHGIAVLGEATKRLSRDFRTRHADVPWRKIAGMRDKLIHDYDQVDLAEVWRVVTVAVPALLTAVEPLLDEAG